MSNTQNILIILSLIVWFVLIVVEFIRKKSEYRIAAPQCRSLRVQPGQHEQRHRGSVGGCFVVEYSSLREPAGGNSSGG